MPERWSIARVEQRYSPDPQLGLKTITVVRFRTKDGYFGTLEIDDPAPTAEKIRPLLEAEVKRVEELFALKG